ncbi:transporter substrate-binding domain-containing protein [Citricoccus alkalitolerans]|uniref:Transporter substrate-binding domain-containing protein n=1 Tax=Citricoccus alkalitolerans TaxID=246603 RepID=A0ABV8XZL1_9MICC
MRGKCKWWSSLAAGLALAAALALTGCTSSGYPADPEGTIDKATNGTLNVGVVHHPPYVDASGAEPSGPEVELVEGFARKIGAEIEWTVSGEEAVMTALQAGDLDLVAGGLTSQSPWSTHGALTRDYAEDTGPDGKPVKLVMAVPLGENQMLTELEGYLDSTHQGAQP